MIGTFHLPFIPILEALPPNRSWYAHMLVFRIRLLSFVSTRSLSLLFLANALYTLN